MRHVGWSKQERDADDNVLGFLPAAFEHKPGENDLSVNWLEYFGNQHAANATASKADMQKAFTGRKSKFGVAQVGRVKALAKYNSKPVLIVYAPTFKIASHSDLHIVKPVPELVHEALALEFYKQHY